MMFSSSSILLADAGVWYAFANSDAMGKGIVFLLFISSMVAWFIMIEKGLALYRAQKLSERFAASFNNQHGMNSVLRDGMENPCPVAKVYISGMEQLLEFYGQTAEELRNAAARRDDRGPRKLSPAQLDAVQTAMEREISGQIFIIEERIGMLATAVSLAPFLGLFGTVWGVMIAFCGVASAGSANIQALAPGVAGALLTTVAGLVVAIPSLVGYNFLTQMIRKITVSMDNFSESFMARLKLEQLGAKDPEENKVIAAAGSAVNTVNTLNAPAGDQQPVPASQIPANVPRGAYNVPPQSQSAAQNVYNANAYRSAPAPASVQHYQQSPAAAGQHYSQNTAPAPAPAVNAQHYQQPAPVPQMPTAAEQMSFNNMGSDPDDSMKG